MGELSLFLKQNQFKPIYHCFYDLLSSKDSLAAFSEMGGGLIACFLLQLIYAETIRLWETQDD